MHGLGLSATQLPFDVGMIEAHSILGSYRRYTSRRTTRKLVVSDRAQGNGYDDRWNSYQPPKKAAPLYDHQVQPKRLMPARRSHRVRQKIHTQRKNQGKRGG
jgi:hypothetical protein